MDCKHSSREFSTRSKTIEEVGRLKGAMEDLVRQYVYVFEKSTDCVVTGFNIERVDSSSIDNLHSQSILKSIEMVVEVPNNKED